MRGGIKVHTRLPVDHNSSSVNGDDTSNVIDVQPHTRPHLASITYNLEGGARKLRKHRSMKKRSMKKRSMKKRSMKKRHMKKRSMKKRHMKK